MEPFPREKRPSCSYIWVRVTWRRQVKIKDCLLEKTRPGDFMNKTGHIPGNRINFNFWPGPGIICNLMPRHSIKSRLGLIRFCCGLSLFYNRYGLFYVIIIDCYRCLRWRKSYFAGNLYVGGLIITVQKKSFFLLVKYLCKAIWLCKNILPCKLIFFIIYS